MVRTRITLAVTVVCLVVGLGFIGYYLSDHLWGTGDSAAQLGLTSSTELVCTTHPCVGDTLKASTMIFGRGKPPALNQAKPYVLKANMIGCAQRVSYSVGKGKWFVLFNSGSVPMTLSGTARKPDGTAGVMFPVFTGPLAHNWWLKAKANLAGTYIIRAKRSTCPNKSSYASVLTFKVT